MSDGSGEELTLTHKHSSSLLCPSTSSRLRSHASTAPSSTARPVSCLDHTVYDRSFAVLGVVCASAFVSPFPLSVSLTALCFPCLPHSPSLFSAPPSAFIGRPLAAAGAWNIVDDVTHGGEATSFPIDTRYGGKSARTSIRDNVFSVLCLSFLWQYMCTSILKSLLRLLMSLCTRRLRNKRFRRRSHSRHRLWWLRRPHDEPRHGADLPVNAQT